MKHLRSGSPLVGENLTLRIGTRTLVRDGALTLTRGTVTALVGPNGSGKSTVLRLLAARAGVAPAPDATFEGRVTVEPGARAGLLPQDVRLEWSGTLASFIDAAGGEAMAAASRYAELAARLEGADAATLAEYGALLDTMERLGAWDVEARRDRIVAGLGLDAELLERPTHEVSGGEATRAALAAVLLAGADILLLDEPTNNLDLAGIDFLRAWLTESGAATLLVSHDRVFLDEVATSVAAIEEATATLRVYGGNWSFYEARHAEETAAATRRWERQEQHRAALERAAGEIDDRALRYEGISANDFQRHKAAKVAAKAKALESRIERELTSLDAPQPPRAARVSVRSPAITSGTLVRLVDARVSIDGRDVLRGVSLSVRAAERVAVTGPNGAGKSTLLRIFGGELSPAAGSVDRVAGLRVAFVHQTPERPRHGETLLEWGRRRVDGAAGAELRAELGRVVFRDVARHRASDVSVGELRRVELAAMLASAPDLLLLDEVTNHLDVQTIELLETSLADYRGAVVAVSHDRRFLENLRPGRTLEIVDGRMHEALR